MPTEVVTTQDRATALAAERARRVGEAANQVAAKHVFIAYRMKKAENTLNRQDAGLALFARYLAEVNVLVPSEDEDARRPEPGDGEEVEEKWAAWLSAQGRELATEPDAWKPVTWGLVAGFQQWQLQRGYAVSSVNVRISTVKTYAKQALKAGTLSDTEYALIRAVESYSHSECKRVDEKREMADMPTRIGAKKVDPKALAPDQVEALKDQPGTPQGRRDRLLICLLFDHGLRVGEIAGLTVTDFDLKAGELHFYRPKVNKVQTHKLTPDALQAARAYIEQDALATGPLMRGSRRDGRLHDAGMSTRNLTERVRVLGKRIGIKGLSAHDGRHTWATLAARSKTPIDRLQQAGGWKSPAMPLRYVEAAKIANEGVKLE